LQRPESDAPSYTEDRIQQWLPFLSAPRLLLGDFLSDFDCIVVAKQVVVLLLLVSNCLTQQKADTAKERSMAFVGGGSFQVGIDLEEIPRFQKIFDISTPQLFQDEVPKHWVTLDDFYMDENLVTNAQFRVFVEANPEWQPGRLDSKLDNGNYLKQWKTPDQPLARPDHPVVNVNWYAAVAYCNWAGKRLPSEAEWEYAARGGRNGLFSWGSEPADKTRANFSDSEIKTTTPVGSYPANGYGVYDMGGNVWQFLLDEWKPYSSLSQKNPVAGGGFLDAASFLHVKTRRVIRGGSFDGAPVNLWVEYRDSHPPDGSRDFVGFRCASEVRRALKPGVGQ
jgi:formylglycine-generating enzyme required for sulfatase activity